MIANDKQIRKLREVVARYNLSDLILLTMYALGEMPTSRLHPNNRYQESARQKCSEIISLLHGVAPQITL